MEKVLDETWDEGKVICQEQLSQQIKISLRINHHSHVDNKEIQRRMKAQNRFCQTDKWSVYYRTLENDSVVLTARVDEPFWKGIKSQGATLFYGASQMSIKFPNKNMEKTGLAAPIDDNNSNDNGENVSAPVGTIEVEATLPAAWRLEIGDDFIFN